MTIRTPDVPPLWDHPLPPIIKTQPPVDVWFGHPIPKPFPQRPPLGPPLPIITPNSRHPLTGAPIFNPDLPADTPLPPSPHVPVQPNARHPVTGALLYFRADQPIPYGWEI